MAESGATELFLAAGLAPCGSGGWGKACDEKRPGVYVVVANEVVVYIGRTRTSLAKRLGQSYRHRYGRPADFPKSNKHRGARRFRNKSRQGGG